MGRVQGREGERFELSGNAVHACLLYQGCSGNGPWGHQQDPQKHLGVHWSRVPGNGPARKHCCSSYGTSLSVESSQQVHSQTKPLTPDKRQEIKTKNERLQTFGRKTPTARERVPELRISGTLHQVYSTCMNRAASVGTLL